MWHELGDNKIQNRLVCKMCMVDNVHSNFSIKYSQTRKAESYWNTKISHSYYSKLPTTATFMPCSETMPHKGCSVRGARLGHQTVQHSTYCSLGTPSKLLQLQKWQCLTLTENTEISMITFLLRVTFETCTLFKRIAVTLTLMTAYVRCTATTVLELYKHTHTYIRQSWRKDTRKPTQHTKTPRALLANFRGRDSLRLLLLLLLVEEDRLRPFDLRLSCLLPSVAG